MKSIFKIDFNTDTKIVLAVLKRFRGHKTNFKYQIPESLHRVLTTYVVVVVAVVDRKVRL